MSRAETKTWAFAQLVPSIETMRRPFWVFGKSGFQKGYIRVKGLAPVQGIACSIHALYCDICWLQLTYIFLKLKPAKKLFWVTVPILRGYSIKLGKCRLYMNYMKQIMLHFAKVMFIYGNY